MARFMRLIGGRTHIGHAVAALLMWGAFMLGAWVMSGEAEAVLRTLAIAAPVLWFMSREERDAERRIGGKPSQVFPQALLRGIKTADFLWPAVTVVALEVIARGLF